MSVRYIMVSIKAAKSLDDEKGKKEKSGVDP